MQETLVRSQSVVARVVAGETLIVPIRAKVGDLASIYSFNGTGSMIWDAAGVAENGDPAGDDSGTAYEVDPVQVQQDVTEFVA